MEEKIYLRRVKETDMKLLFDWRNNELVRKNSFCMDPVEWNEHVKWFNTTLVKSSVLFFILICKEQEVGQILQLSIIVLQKNIEVWVMESKFYI